LTEGGTPTAAGAHWPRSDGAALASAVAPCVRALGWLRWWWLGTGQRRRHPGMHPARTRRQHLPGPGRCWVSPTARCLDGVREAWHIYRELKLLGAVIRVVSSGLNMAVVPHGTGTTHRLETVGVRPQLRRATLTVVAAPSHGRTGAASSACLVLGCARGTPFTQSVAAP
jgi:hypothetical protein